MRNLRRYLSGRLLIVSLLLVVPVLASDVRAEGARIRGTIRAVDLHNQTVAIDPAQGATVVLHTNERTEITRNGEPARLSDLQAGDGAGAAYDTRTRLASEIAAREIGRASCRERV